MTAVEPEVFTVKRYRCPFCRRGHSTRVGAAKHITRCWYNPAAKGCKTCTHYEPAEPGDWAIGDPGAAEGCGADVDLTGRPACGHCGGANSVYTGEVFRPRFAAPGAVMAQCPECKGNGAEVKPGPIIHCSLWESLSVPVWLLDVDGVINACTKNPDRNVWPADQWVRHDVAVNGRTFPILAAQPVLDFITKVHTEGLAEVRWHTTWQKDAASIEAAFGLPSMPVQECPEYDIRDSITAWFKLAAAERVVTEERRALVWTDDDLNFVLDAERRAIDAFRTVGRVLTVSPSSQTGLTPKHLRTIAEFLHMDDAERAA